MKVLHLASFKGNTGDVINHMGFYDFMKDIGQDWVVTQMEMRQFYKNRNERQFDQSFVDEVNTYDLLVIGGGNFLSPWLQSSATGTTFDIDLTILANIHAKVLFNAVGCEASLGYTDETLQRLGRLLDFVADHPTQYLFTVRNDGSYEAINTWFKGKYKDSIVEVPDFGLYHNHIDKQLAHQCQRKDKIGFAVSSDRFKAKWQGDYDHKLSGYAKMVETVAGLYSEMDVVFIPHTYFDLEAIYKIADMLPDHIRRNQLMVAPLVTNEADVDRVIAYYYDCKLLIGSRFHSCIQAYKTGSHIISLYPDHRTKALMTSLGLGEQAINLMADDYAERVIGLAEHQLDKASHLGLNDLKLRFKRHQDILNQWL